MALDRETQAQAEASNSVSRPRRIAAQRHASADSSLVPGSPTNTASPPANAPMHGPASAAGNLPIPAAALQQMHSSSSLPAKRPVVPPAQASSEHGAVAALDADGAKRARQAKKQFQDDITDPAKPRQPPALTAAAAAAALPGYDVLFGCPKCRYAKNGCGVCRANPSITRDKGLRWRPNAGRPQTVRSASGSCNAFAITAARRRSCTAFSSAEMHLQARLPAGVACRVAARAMRICAYRALKRHRPFTLRRRNSRTRWRTSTAAVQRGSAPASCALCRRRLSSPPSHWRRCVHRGCCSGSCSRWGRGCCMVTAHGQGALLEIYTCAARVSIE